MATQHEDDNGPSIVDKFFKAAVAGAQQKFQTQIDVVVAETLLHEFLRKWDGTHKTFHKTKSAVLDKHLPPNEERPPTPAF